MGELQLIIVHYHLRPGGIRRIIELATPHLVHASGRAIDRVVLAVGEAADKRWNTFFTNHLAPTPMDFFIEPAFNYLAEQRGLVSTMTRRVRAAVEKLFADATNKNTLVWFHNPGVGRNLVLVRELTRVCDAKKIPCIAHHHDWWFDNRWRRWPQMQRVGLANLESAAKVLFPASAHVRHVAINLADAAILQRHLSRRAGWLPNLTKREPAPPAMRLRQARGWLRRKLRNDAPVWMLPCRLLRRKNITEALLLTRWLRPEAWLVTTGGVSSPDEKLYAEKLAKAAHHHHWRLRLAILAGDEVRSPSVPELLAVSEAVLLTSVQEGFGLPYLEAAVSRRPLIARAIPNVAPDLKKFGFHFPQNYSEIFVSPDLFDWRAERQRQEKLFAAWCSQLPPACRRLTGEPALLAQARPSPTPFSRLTLSAQLEVLAHPASESWEHCAPLNPFLSVWKSRAAKRRLQVTPWPRRADVWLSGPAYARRFYQLAHRPLDDHASARAGVSAQRHFVRTMLDASRLFPLLWALQS